MSKKSSTTTKRHGILPDVRSSMSCPGSLLSEMTTIVVERKASPYAEGSLQHLVRRVLNEPFVQTRREAMSGDNATAIRLMSGDRRQQDRESSSLNDQEFLEELEVPKSLINLGDEHRILSWLIQQDEAAEEDPPAQ